MSVLIEKSLSDIVGLFVFLFTCIILSIYTPQKMRGYFFVICLIHVLATIYYYYYSLNNVADSTMYYITTRNVDTSWSNMYGSGIQFIEFFMFPFVHYLGLSYFGLFFIFSSIGLIGHYLLLKMVAIVAINVRSFVYLLMLPQLHFWTCAIGKDSLIFFLLVLILWGWYHRKLSYIIISLLIISQIRVHIFIVVVVSLLLSEAFCSRKKLTHDLKFWVLLVISIAGLAVFIPKFMTQIGSETIHESMEYADRIAQIASNTSSSGAYIDLTNANLIEKMFAYLFRPLFFDARSILTLEASFENLIWLYIFVYSVRAFRKLLKNNKCGRNSMAFPLIAFFLLLIVLSYSLYNLGIAARQKMMIFPFLFFVYLTLKSNFKRITLAQ